MSEKYAESYESKDLIDVVILIRGGLHQIKVQSKSRTIILSLFKIHFTIIHFTFKKSKSISFETVIAEFASYQTYI